MSNNQQANMANRIGANHIVRGMGAGLMLAAAGVIAQLYYLLQSPAPHPLTAVEFAMAAVAVPVAHLALAMLLAGGDLFRPVARPRFTLPDPRSAASLNPRPATSPRLFRQS
ncbi:hypothetical protein [Novosphingobium lentum]|uniref:hypothetical protein n=1 Tax=Novosphingobium lentum TaxID=145287 RepID=UPI00082FD0F7|nr:hypothetical protein [Novosphingobium lentum]